MSETFPQCDADALSRTVATLLDILIEEEKDNYLLNGGTLGIVGCPPAIITGLKVVFFTEEVER